jgi:hypothetical protein
MTCAPAANRKPRRVWPNEVRQRPVHMARRHSRCADERELPLMVILPAGCSAVRSAVPPRFTYLAKKGSRSRGILRAAAARTRDFIVSDGKI